LISQKRGSGQDLLTLRDYLPNDDLRRVDWKATARSRGLIVREFAAEDDRKITVILDPRLPQTEGSKLTLREKLDSEQEGKSTVVSDRFERAIRLAASLLSHFAEQQAEVRLVIDSNSEDFGVGSRHLVEDLKRLAVLEPVMADEVRVNALESMVYEMIESDEISHYFVLTTLPETAFSPEIAQKSQVLQY
jgi:uncharacterized protein (DUF58 family)